MQNCIARRVHSAFFILPSALNWQAASVLPRANGVLETLLRKLAHGLFDL